jgi:hypothetical protein
LEAKGKTKEQVFRERQRKRTRRERERERKRRETYSIWINDADLAKPFTELFRIFRVLTIGDTETEDPVLNFARLDPSCFGQRVRSIELSDDREGRTSERG